MDKNRDVFIIDNRSVGGPCARYEKEDGDNILCGYMAIKIEWRTSESPAMRRIAGFSF